MIITSLQVKSVHLHVKTTTFVSRRKGGGGHRGVEQRNRGLKWIRENHGLSDTRNGVVYFGDDDNGYDVKLFEEVSPNSLSLSMSLRLSLSLFPITNFYHFFLSLDALH